MTHEQAIYTWISRLCHKRGIFAADEIADVEFGVGDGWPGTDVTPGDEDFAVIRFRLRQGDEWEQHEVSVEGIPPAQIVAECLAIYEEAVAGSPTSPRVDAAIAHVQGAHWGGSLSCPAPSVTREVFMHWVREARTLASEVRRLRTLVGLLAARRDGP